MTSAVRFLLAAAAVALLSGCANTGVPRLESVPSPAAITVEEQRWSEEADAFERKLEEKGAFFEDAEAGAWLDATRARLLEAAGASGTSTRVRLLRPSIFNVIVLSNGLVAMDVLYLSILDDGAQLAAVLGHEFEHRLDRHRLRSERERRNQRAIGMVAMLPLVALGLGDLGMRAADKMVDDKAGRYSREQEKDADLAGLRMAAAAGYDVRDAPVVFEHMMALEAEGRRNQVEVRPADRTHPPAIDRLTLLREAVLALQAEGVDLSAGRRDREGFERAFASAFLENARSFLDRHMPERARREVERSLAARPDSAEGWYMKAEVARLESTSDPSRASESLAAYRRATELDPRMAKAWRGLGLGLRDRGRIAESKDPLRRYLAADPAAVDRPVVEAWLAE